MRSVLSGVAAMVVVLVMSADGGAQETSPRYENLQVLPADISRDALTDTMLGFLSSLGLPRRAGEGCLHCHEGSLDVPRGEWDYASDAKPTKRTARSMVAMVRAINEEHLAALDERRWPSLHVGCQTCHAGRVDPRPISDVLSSAYEAAGADSAGTAYRALYERHGGSGAYDFRVSTLANMARELAESGSYEDAILLARVNEETHAADPSARRVTLSLIVQQALDNEGVVAALERFETMTETEPAGVVTESLLDGVGWRTFRLDREEEALVLFEANREAFPDSYFTFESVTEALQGAGRITREEIIRRYEAYLADHPGHEMAQAQLTNHRRRN